MKCWLMPLRSKVQNCWCSFATNPCAETSTKLEVTNLTKTLIKRENSLHTKGAACTLRA